MLLPVLPHQAAERGFVAVFADLAAGTVSLSGPGSTGPWWSKATGCRPGWAFELAAKGRIDGSVRSAMDAAGIDRLLGAGASAPANNPATLALLCLSPGMVDGGTDALFAGGRARGSKSWSSVELRRTRESVDCNGFSMPHGLFDRLSALAKRALIPEAAERLVVPVQ